MAGKTLEERFLEKLKLMGGATSVVSNKNLAEALNWSDKSYQNVRTRLVEAKAISKAPAGPGGGVRVSDVNDTPARSPIRAFVSYSHADETLKNELLKHLVPLTRLGLISQWNDMELKAGDNWNKEISDRLAETEIVILLISVDFINSFYSYDKELKIAAERQAAGQCVLIPVIGRNCLWQTLPIGETEALPKDGKAISSWADQDEALTNVADGVRKVAEGLSGVR